MILGSQALEHKATTRKENLRLLFLTMLPKCYLLLTSKVGAENTRWESVACLDDLVCVAGATVPVAAGRLRGSGEARCALNSGCAAPWGPHP